MAAFSEVVAQVKIRNFDFGIFYLSFYCMEITGKVRKISLTRYARLWRFSYFFVYYSFRSGRDLPATREVLSVHDQEGWRNRC